jgi:hypothetical protein
VEVRYLSKGENPEGVAGDEVLRLKVWLLEKRTKDINRIWRRRG